MEDKEIVEVYFKRDERAINETRVKYGSYCMMIALNILSVREDAEECVSDAYLHTWSAIPPHRPNPLSAFVGKIVRNISFNRYNKLHAQKRGGGETAAILDELCEIVSDKADVESEADAKQLAADINAFVNALPDMQRYCFLRRYFYCDSVKTIADSCKKTDNAVSVTLNRIREKLRNYLTERGYDL